MTMEKTAKKNGPAAIENGSGKTRKSAPRPFYIEGETAEAREKRLAKRKAGTLKLLQMAYEDHQKSIS